MRRNLPPPDVERWTPRRKAQIVDAVAKGEMTVDTVCEHYRISRDEFLAWKRLESRFGISGLQTTRSENYRKRAEG